MTITAQAPSPTVSIDRPWSSQLQNRAPPKCPSLANLFDFDDLPGRTIYIVDDDEGIRDVLTDTLEEYGFSARSFASGPLLLRDFHPGDADCLLVDQHLPNMSGIEVIAALKIIKQDLPVILVTGNSTFEAAVRAMKAGAVDFIQKPFKSKTLIDSIKLALSNAQRRRPHASRMQESASQDFYFTHRECEILERVLDGQPSKNIAADLGISQRTVENHRASIMRKTGSKSVPQLVRATLEWHHLARPVSNLLQLLGQKHCAECSVSDAWCPLPAGIIAQRQMQKATLES